MKNILLILLLFIGLACFADGNGGNRKFKNIRAGYSAGDSMLVWIDTNGHEHYISMDEISGSGVTSVGVSSSDLTVSNSPITSSGDIILNIADDVIDANKLNTNNSPTDAYMLSYSWAANSLTWIAPTTGGTVTSAGIVSSDFEVTNSPITSSGNITLNLADDVISNQPALTSLTFADEFLVSDAGVLKRMDASVLLDYLDLPYILPTASSTTLGGVKVYSADGGLTLVGDYIVQKDNLLDEATPLTSDYIAFYDASGTAQRKCYISDLLDLVGDLFNLRNPTPQSITTSASLATYINFYTTASSDKTITFSNTFDGASGQIEVTYSAASVITFAHASYDVNIAENIHSSGDAVLSKSSGTAIYSYYVRNSNIYINGTQTYN